MKKNLFLIFAILIVSAVILTACAPVETPEPPTATTSAPVSSPTLAPAEPYLGQTPPGLTPVIFAPGVVSAIGRYEYGLSISPDGNELFFTADSPGIGLTVIRRIDGQWTEPEAANLRGNDSWEFEAFFTVDGQKLFFASSEATQDETSKLWQMEKGASGWEQPKLLESPVNAGSVFWATFTRDGTMYYTNVDERKIYRSKQVNGIYPDVEDAGLPVGSLHPSVSPDEQFLLFNSRGDLFVSFRQSDGAWGSPKKLGPEINTAYQETCATLSPDGRYIFFSRYDEPGGQSNIYWVSSAALPAAEPATPAASAATYVKAITKPARHRLAPDFWGFARLKWVISIPKLVLISELVGVPPKIR